VTATDHDPAALQARFEQALALHRAGRLDEAEAGYRALCELAPAHPAAWQLRGVIAAQRGDHASALALAERALALAPEDPGALASRGNALRAMGRVSEALASFDAALAIAPGAAELHNNRAACSSALGQHEAALAGFQRALALKPGYLEAAFNVGNALRALGRRDQALDAYAAALAIAPDQPAVLTNRAALLCEAGRAAEALADLARVLARAPDDAEALINRADALRQLKRPAEALASADAARAAAPRHPGAHCCRGDALVVLARDEEALADYGRALELDPRHHQSLTNRGTALGRLGRLAEALADQERAVALAPGSVQACLNHANALGALRRFEEALAACERALALDPTLAEARFGRANMLRNLRRYGAAHAAYRELLAEHPDHPYALGYAVHSALHACEWRTLEVDRARLIAGVASGALAEVPFSFLAVCDDPALQRRCAADYAAREHPALAPVARPARAPGARIRLGYLSADLHDHATAFLIAELIEHHDRERFEVIAYSYGAPSDGPMRRRLRAAFERFAEVGALTDAELAARLAADGIDIAVDLKGFTQGGRPGVLARRPAPVQVSYLGFPGTLGAPYVDYLIADAELVPAGQEHHYAERIVRLPDSYQPNDRQRALADEVPSRAALGLPDAGFVFCCFNNDYKITPEVFAVWMRLLAAVPGSVLWLFEANPDAAANLRREAAARGVAPARLVFAPRLPLAEHLARQQRADLFLDTLPVNAHTTASDALWVGLPLLTCRGAGFAARVAASLLRAVGLPELIVDDLAAYEATALALARDPARLAALRARLAAARDGAPLFDAARTCRHLEDAYRTMHERAQRGFAPEGFDVPARG
jgi:predicted O-linked N-acetylglucosamine transferase (SPINDLY family)